MANRRPKGREYMRTLGRRGGLASGKARELKRVGGIIGGGCLNRQSGVEPATEDDGYSAAVHEVWDATGRRDTVDQTAEVTRPRDNRGGSHDSDWRCPSCRRFISTRLLMCMKCECLALANGRKTRAALREAAADHGTMAYLRRFGI
jgi:hypothetical protein